MEGQFGSLPEADESGLGAGGSGQAGPELAIEVLGVGGGCIREVAPFDAVPDVFDGVQLGCVAGQSYGFESIRVDASGRGSVHRPPIPDDDHVAADVSPQIAKERDDVLGLEVAVLAGAKVEAEAIATWSQRQRGHDRHVLPVTTADGQDRCLTSRSQRATDEGIQQEAALVDENKGGPLAARPF